MYKLTSDRTNFLERTGSHSTKPRQHESAAQIEAKIFAQIEDFSLEELQDFRERQMKQLAVLNETFNKQGLGGAQKHSPLLGREKMRLQLAMTLANRRIKSLRRTATVCDDADAWRLAAKWLLSLSESAQLETYRSEIHRYTTANGFPPTNRQALEEFMLRAQLLRERTE